MVSQEEEFKTMVAGLHYKLGAEQTVEKRMSDGSGGGRTRRFYPV